MRARWALVALITVAALVARLVGIDALLPHQPEPDLYLVPQAAVFRYQDDIDFSQPGPLGKYPHLLARILAWIPPDEVPSREPPLPGGAGPGDAATTTDTAALDAWRVSHLRAAASDALHARLLVAFLSIFTLPLTYALARRFLEGGPALLATAMTAASLLFTAFSQQGRPHGALATFMTLALVAAVRLQRRADWTSLLGASAATALAAGCLHNGLAVVPAGLVAFLSRAPVAAEGRRRVPWWAIVVPVVVIAAAVRFFYPFLFVTREGDFGALSTDAEGLEQGGHRLMLDWINGAGFAEMYAHIMGYDPWLFVLAVLGLVMLGLAWRRGRLGPVRWRHPAVVVAAFALPYTLANGMLLTTVERYLIPLLPVLAILAAYGLRELLRLALPRAGERRRLAIGTALSLLVLAAPAYVCARLAWIRVQPDTLELAAAWIEQRLTREKARIAVSPGFSPPLFQSTSSLAYTRAHARIWRTRWQLYQEHLFEEVLDAKTANRVGWRLYPIVPRASEPKSMELLESPAQVKTILEGVRAGWALVVPSAYRGDPTLPGVAGLGTKVASFISAPEHRAAGFQGKGGLLWRVLGSDRTGPALHVYRIDRTAH